MFDTRYCLQFSQFFNTSVLKDIAERQHSPYINATIKDSGYKPQLVKPTFRRLFEDVYRLLENLYRCEYIYKNSIANSLLLERHSLVESTLLSELTIEDCRADLIIINGEATAYEIKTELDSLVRLPKQIENYLRMFSRVYVVASDTHLPKLEGFVPEYIGIISLGEDSSLTTVRRATDNYEFINPGTIFDALRRAEYCNIIKEEFGFVPDVPNTRIYSECRDLFCQLKPSTAYKRMISALRTRNSSSFFRSLVHSMPYSLRMACFQSSLTKRQWRKLQKSLDQYVVPA